MDRGRTRESQNRIIEWFGLERTFRGHLAQPPCHGQGYLPLDQVAQRPIQAGLEQLPGGSNHSFSGQPVPVPHKPHGKECCPYVQCKSTLFQLKATNPCPITPCLCKKSLCRFLVALIHVLEGCYKVSLKPSSLQAEPPQLSPPFFRGEVFHPSHHFCGPPLDPFQQVHVLVMLRAPELDGVLQVRSCQSRAEWQNHLPQSAGHNYFYAAQYADGLLGCERHWETSWNTGKKLKQDKFQGI